ncbi:deoxycytidylate deaminase [Salpingoeca rosetta]|uniref:dCMP deaminase n=1 Tax=Salpingoeca rosetta (strain ATCC 50818 / BSB-021) TaxID=946362 RepID=F2UML0_SALR5|nr:deoxycytidylate deaminase [Salpingoeca rosetta]EGD78359.1 deoxycytidylate deaminase [Salpingoeca rosetta]|eukprot:XP_004989682.1 deoxycytidylate deaminase [Salpingoeca rosetta]
MEMPPQPQPQPQPRRQRHICWEDYFMAVAFLSAQRSKDPESQFGACIVNSENKIVGIGYNGMPRGCSDDKLPWRSQGDSVLDTKYPFVCQAEMNAILNRNSSSIRGCRIYVMQFPDNESAKLIIQAGIKEVVYVADEMHNATPYMASRRLFKLARVKCRRFEPTETEIEIDFEAVQRNVMKPRKA